MRGEGGWNGAAGGLGELGGVRYGARPEFHMCNAYSLECTQRSRIELSINVNELSDQLQFNERWLAGCADSWR